MSAPAVVREPDELVLTSPTVPCCWRGVGPGDDSGTAGKTCAAHRTQRAADEVLPMVEPERCAPVEMVEPEEPRRFGRQWALSKNFGCADGPVHPERGW